MKFKKIFLTFCVTLLVIVPLFSVFFRDGLILDMAGIHLDSPLSEKVTVKENYLRVDKNQNNIADPLDIVNAAREEAGNRTLYKSIYYEGGYPPDSEGVCTDVIWRGMAGANINLKDLMDRDIYNHTSLYPRVERNPDPNIDFRRVPNQNVFFQRFTESLTTELIPNNPENLAEWQPGDIVIYLEGTDHAGIVSDKRTKDGIPYLIHNTPPFASEIKLTSYKKPIVGHYRWKY
ncbi:DUF1287 domain-containing protein [Filibacter tadaridae]|uniref:DUF1287 domain-containing protein n=2 Tax=Filibacter tadaridae TaxID=2483811 RepID=A0A3P5XNZ8_9BACL|nr:hypothetical protein FILTAD_02138 [Filibacter tadaridae]